MSNGPKGPPATRRCEKPMGLRQESQTGRRRARGRLLLGGASAAVAVLAIAIPAAAGGLLPNPANDGRLINKPIDDEQYDSATKCRHKTPPGMKALVDWMEHNVRGD